MSSDIVLTWKRALCILFAVFDAQEWILVKSFVVTSGLTLQTLTTPDFLSYINQKSKPFVLSLWKNLGNSCVLILWLYSLLHSCKTSCNSPWFPFTSLQPSHIVWKFSVQSAGCCWRVSWRLQLQTYQRSTLSNMLTHWSCNSSCNTLSKTTPRWDSLCQVDMYKKWDLMRDVESCQDSTTDIL